MTETIDTLLAALGVLGQIAIVLILAAGVAAIVSADVRRALLGSWSALQLQAQWAAWVVAAVATGGSMYFSEIAHYIPCQLCWYQRICMYPLAIVLLGAGLVGARLHRRDGEDEAPSWITCGPALVVAFAPTVWLAFVDPGSIRPLVGLVAGALVLVAGAVWGKRALVDVGAATVAALGLQQLAPVVGEIPNWATIGATGILLLAVGATSERKGHLDFLRVARAMDPAGAGRTRFYVVGAQPGAYLDRLERFVRDEGLRSVVLVDKTPDVYDYFRMSDVFVCSSYNE